MASLQISNQGAQITSYNHILWNPSSIQHRIIDYEHYITLCRVETYHILTKLGG